MKDITLEELVAQAVEYQPSVVFSVCVLQHSPLRHRPSVVRGLRLSHVPSSLPD